MPAFPDFVMRHHLKRFVRCATALLCNLAILSAEPGDSATTPVLPEALAGISRIEFDLPVYDYPYNGIDGYSFPSMRQSLALTQDATQAIHYGLARYGLGPGGDQRMKRQVFSFGVMLSELALLSLPGGYVWLHEEWHRAVLRQHGVGSYNGVYDFKLLASAIPVKKVSDEALATFKRDHPLDMIRLAAAGNEAHIEFVRSLRKELFFNRTDCSLDWLTLLFNTIQASSYVTMCSMPYADQVTKEMEQHEGTDIAQRDILGMDFTAWVYDLFRPDESYYARDAHPSGVGVDRYIKHAELTREESNYLLLQGILCWLNLFNPQLFLVNRFEHKDIDSVAVLHWNAAVVHHLTPFGFAVDGDVLLKVQEWNLFATLHSFMNRRSYCPGISAGIDDRPISLGAVTLYAGLELSGWLQPENLGFESRKAQPGGCASASLKFAPVPYALLTAEGYAKTAGWKAGVLSLSSEYGGRTGISIWFPHHSRRAGVPATR